MRGANNRRDVTKRTLKLTLAEYRSSGPLQLSNKGSPILCNRHKLVSACKKKKKKKNYMTYTERSYQITLTLSVKPPFIHCNCCPS